MARWDPARLPPAVIASSKVRAAEALKVGDSKVGAVTRTETGATATCAEAVGAAADDSPNPLTISAPLTSVA